MMESTYPNESTGITDWHKNVGRTVRTEGCMFFFCLTGQAIVSVNMQKAIFHKGDLLVLTSDVYLWVAEVSAGFSVRYVSLSEIMIEAAYYKVTSISLWDYLHYVPILRLSLEHRQLMVGWMGQMEWILANISGTSRDAMLNNNVYNLFMAIDTVLVKSGGNMIPERKDQAWVIVCRFWSLLTKHSFRERAVGFYANA
ncbi:MAG: hypothetical protein K2L23_06005, partial [Odoribacter sp.]|nr:hypothetical protein [Odoribacter sp.]